MTILAISILIPLTILCIVTVEAILWSYTIYTHCSWIRKNNVLERRNISHPTLCFLSALAGVFSFLIWVGTLYIFTTASLAISCLIFLYCISMAFQVMIIHKWFIISKYIYVPFEFIPWTSRVLLRTVKNLFGDDGCYNIEGMSLSRWEQIFEMSSKYKPLAINFLDICPDLIWTKNMDNVFTYVNKSICKKLLLMPEYESLGMTSSQIAEKHRTGGMVYTFGELCCDSDEETKERSKPTLFYEYGLIDNKFVALRVLKSPIYNTEGKMVGTIGVARDVTVHHVDYKNIEDLYIAGDCEGAMGAFLLHKTKFEAMKDLQDLELFTEKGMR